MSPSEKTLSIEKDRYTLRGRIVHFGTTTGVPGLRVVAWDHDLIPKHDQLGQSTTNEEGEFVIHFTRKQFAWLFDRKPDLFFEIYDGETLIKSTADNIIRNADQSTPPILIPLSTSQKSITMAQINPSECSLFIQVWVDTKSLQNGSTQGVYIVDSNHNNGSSNEGTPSLHSQASTNTKICWSILNIDPNSDVALSFQNFGNASVWGAGGTPKPYNSANTIWTGQVEANGSAAYDINFNAEKGTGITITVNPSISVS